MSFSYLTASVASHCNWDIFLILNQVCKTYTVHSVRTTLALTVVTKTALAIWPFTVPWIHHAILATFFVALLSELYFSMFAWLLPSPHSGLTSNVGISKKPSRKRPSHPGLLRLLLSHCLVDFFLPHWTLTELSPSIYLFMFYLFSFKTSLTKAGPLSAWCPAVS